MRCKFNIIMNKRQKYNKQVALFFTVAKEVKENYHKKILGDTLLSRREALISKIVLSSQSQIHTDDEKDTFRNNRHKQHHRLGDSRRKTR